MTEIAPAADPVSPSGVAPSARSAWPTITDVQVELRLDYLQEGDDDVLQNALDAAVAYVTGRVRPSALVDGAGELVVPDDVWQATVLLAARIYRRRDSLDGTVGWSDTGGALRVPWRDPDVENLLGHWAVIPL